MTGSLLPQGNRVMSLMSFHSQLYNVACVCLCVRRCERSEGGCSRESVRQEPTDSLYTSVGVCCLQLMSFVVVCWLGPSRMLLSCWPPRCPVTHYWKCCNHTFSTVLLYVAILSPRSLCPVPCTLLFLLCCLRYCACIYFERLSGVYQ